MPVSNDDDKELASEVEDALRALGIASSRNSSDRPVERFVRELRGGEIEASTDESDSGSQQADPGL